MSVVNLPHITPPRKFSPPAALAPEPPRRRPRQGFLPGLTKGDAAIVCAIRVALAQSSRRAIVAE